MQHFINHQSLEIMRVFRSHQILTEDLIYIKSLSKKLTSRNVKPKVICMRQIF